jgi:hypothetical protein
MARDNYTVILFINERTIGIYIVETLFRVKDFSTANFKIILFFTLV